MGVGDGQTDPARWGGKAGDNASIAVFLASDDSGWLTGEQLIASGGYVLRARLHVSLPDLDHEVAQALVEAAHQICPCSKATRSNIDVAINLV